MALNQEQASAGTATAHAAQSGFSQLLTQEFRPKTDQARAAVERAVQTLAEQALHQSTTITDDAYKSIEALIAQIDHKLSEQINLILHHPDFQKLESAWRGLHHLASNTETDERLKIRFMDVSKDALRRTMKRYKGIAWDQSPLFKKIYEEEYGQLGGEPYGCLVADYYFDHTPPDVDLLGSIAKVAAASHTPFISGASPSVLQMESWQELANPRDLTRIFAQNLEYAPWNSLRNTEDARYIGLAMPRFLVAFAVWREDQSGRRIRLRGRHQRLGSSPLRVGQCRICDGREYQPLVQAIRLVLADSRRRIGRYGGGPAVPHVPDR